MFTILLDTHRIQSKMKSQPFASADWKHKPQPMSCSHTLSTKEKEKALGQHKIPDGTVHPPWLDYKYIKCTSNPEEEEEEEEEYIHNIG